MSKTEVQTRDIKDGEVKRADLNVSELGSAVIRKLIAGPGVVISQTGVDNGTGDVTLRVKDRRTMFFHYNGTTTRNWLRITDSGIRSYQSAIVFEKTYRLVRFILGQRNQFTHAYQAAVRAIRKPDTHLNNISTGDPTAWLALSDDAGSVLVGGVKHWIFTAPDNGTFLFEPGFRYAFRIERLSGSRTWNDVNLTMELEEVVP